MISSGPKRMTKFMIRKNGRITSSGRICDEQRRVDEK